MVHKDPQRYVARKNTRDANTMGKAKWRGELGMYSHKTNRDLRKLKFHYRVKNMQGKRLPAIVDRFVWKKRSSTRGSYELILW